MKAYKYHKHLNIQEMNGLALPLYTWNLALPHQPYSCAGAIAQVHMGL